MRTTNCLFATIASVALMGCINSDHGTSTKPSTTTGKLDVTSVEVTFPDGSDHNTSDYYVEIVDEQNVINASGTLSEMSDTTLDEGTYTLTVSSMKDVPAAAWESPYYVGSTNIDIQKDALTQVGSIAVELRNIGVKVEFTDKFRELMGNDCQVVVTVGLGSLTYTASESRIGYFRASNSGLVLTAEFSGTFDGKYITEQRIIKDVVAGDIKLLTYDVKDEEPPVTPPTPQPESITLSTNKLSFEAAEAAPQEVEIILENCAAWEVENQADWITIEKITIGTNPGLRVSVEDNSAEQLRTATVYVTGSEARAALTVTQLGFAPALVVEPKSLSFESAGGEATVKVTTNLDNYNATCSADWITLTKDANGVQVVAAANPATEERKATIEITTNYSLSATIQITQTAGEPTPPEEGDITLDFVIDVTVSDIDINGNIVVDENDREPAEEPDEDDDKPITPPVNPDPDQPSDLGAPTIVWEGHDLNEWFELTDSSIKVALNIAAPNKIKTLVVDIISDAAAFQQDQLQGVGLDTHLDLSNPGELREAIEGLGFPAGENVVGKTELVFDITDFMPLMVVAEDKKVEFRLTLTDEFGHTVVEGLKLNVNLN
ncbi:MAG: DUF4493 domain-containing protein [Rikenellaceae bacterium]|nr:DUF4493 domain-containing protein [Rikenellaceae bacterium]